MKQISDILVLEDQSATKGPKDGFLQLSRLVLRNVYADGHYWDAPIYQRLEIDVGNKIDGPALLEQPDTTIFIDPDLTGRVDEFGNLIISRKEISNDS